MTWLLPVGSLGVVVAALCCVGVLTPLLVTALVALGLGAWTRSLDLILLPALAAFLIMRVYGLADEEGVPPAREQVQG